MNWLLLTVLLLPFAPLAQADEIGSRTYAGGNAVFTAATVQKITQQLIINGLQNKIQASNGLNGLQIQTEESEHHLSIPESAILNDILKALGIRNELKIAIDPIKTSINFGAESLKIKVTKKDLNHFDILTHWEIPQIRAESTALKIKVPKGTFDRPFTIVSSPIKIALDNRAGPLTADLQLSAELTEQGSLFRLKSFKTNLDDSHHRLHMKLGTLTVHGRPIQLSIQSGNQKIQTDEPTIRNELRKFEPQIMSIVEKKLATLIRAEFYSLSKKLEETEPFKLDFDTTEILNRYTFANEELKKLFSGITGEFLFSYIQELPKLGVFSAQASTRLCIDQTCVNNRNQTSPITTLDLQSMGKDDAGIILYESWVRNLVDAPQFQKRIREYYRKTSNTPGIDLGKSGIRVHFNPARNSIAAVLNLKIDIRKTCDSSKVWGSWAAFREFSKKQIADWWEYMAGSGEYVLIPVEINFAFKGTRMNQHGQPVQVIKTEFPFRPNGKVINTYQYPSNLHLMNASIREELVSAVASQIRKLLPEEILLSMNRPIQFQNMNFFFNHLSVTQNGGLLISGSLP